MKARSGSCDPALPPFASVRRIAITEKAEPHAEEWLLIEWPRGRSRTHQILAIDAAANTSLKALVKMAKHRWIIERDYQELKQELGLGHFEGRNWRGFHHHATLCIAAYGFLVAERNRFSPSARAGHLGFVCPRAGAGLPPARVAAFAPSGIIRIRSRRCESILARLLLRQLPHCPFCGSRSG